MARTSKSRGIENFKMRSPETPYPFLGKIGKGLKNLVNKTPIGMIGNAMKGGGGESGMGAADDVNAKIDEIHAALVGGDETGGGIGEDRTLAAAAKDAALTKKAGPMYHKPHHTDKQVDPKTGSKHYHSARYTGELEGRNPE